MKNKKININAKNEELKEIKTLVVITLIIIILAVGMYFLTEFALEKKNRIDLPEPAISYSETIIGEMFTKPEAEYYIFAYKASDENAAQYDTLFNNQKDKATGVKIYYVDLDNPFNSGALSDKTNKKPTKATEVAINNAALILIKNGKVVKYFEKISEFEKALN